MKKPDLIIGPPDDPYMYRWHIFKVFGFQLALHHTFRSDDDRALHNHSSWNVSFVLRGGYLEQTSHAWDLVYRAKARAPGTLIFRRATTPHRLIIPSGRSSWSLWLRGPPSQEWGFFCKSGFVPWHKYLDGDYKTPGSVSQVGKGCG